jgi:hypothetical protein
MHDAYLTPLACWTSTASAPHPDCRAAILVPQAETVTVEIPMIDGVNNTGSVRAPDALAPRERKTAPADALSGHGRGVQVWHVELPGLNESLLYGWRVAGSSEQHLGHRHDPTCVVLDPYATTIVSRPTYGAMPVPCVARPHCARSWSWCPAAGFAAMRLVGLASRERCLAPPSPLGVPVCSACGAALRESGTCWAHTGAGNALAFKPPPDAFRWPPSPPQLTHTHTR